MAKAEKRYLESGRERRLRKRAERLKKQLKSVPARKLLDLLPDDLLAQVCEDSEVDFQVKRLKGRLMVLLLMQGVLQSKDDSLRSLESLYNSRFFERCSGKGGHQTRHSSLADRLATIKLTFFEQLYAGFVERVGKTYGRRLEKEWGWLRRFDSTLVALSAHLCKIGMRVGDKSKEGPGKVQIKFTVGLQGLIPSSARVFCDQEHLSEEVALRQAIESAGISEDEVAVFDRGLKSRKTLKKFTEQGIFFVTRLSAPRYEAVRQHKKIEGRQHGQLRFVSDQIVRLYRSGEGPVMEEVEYRLIEAVCQQGKNAGQTFFFLTNIMDLTAFEIADIYHKRWDIEIFFRFLKQEVGLGHLLAKNTNGISAVFYTRLLVATMLSLFLWLNNRKDARIAKREFVDQLREEQFLAKAILAGADPDKLE